MLCGNSQKQLLAATRCRCCRFFLRLQDPQTSAPKQTLSCPAIVLAILGKLVEAASCLFITSGTCRAPGFSNASAMKTQMSESHSSLQRNLAILDEVCPQSLVIVQHLLHGLEHLLETDNLCHSKVLDFDRSLWHTHACLCNSASGGQVSVLEPFWEE